MHSLLTEKPQLQSIPQLYVDIPLLQSAIKLQRDPAGGNTRLLQGTAQQLHSLVWRAQTGSDSMLALSFSEFVCQGLNLPFQQQQQQVELFNWSRTLFSTNLDACASQHVWGTSQNCCCSEIAMFVYKCLFWLNWKFLKSKWVQSQRKLSPKRLSYLFHENSTKLKSRVTLA